MFTNPSISFCCENSQNTFISSTSVTRYGVELEPLYIFARSSSAQCAHDILYRLGTMENANRKQISNTNSRSAQNILFALAHISLGESFSPVSFVSMGKPDAAGDDDENIANQKLHALRSNSHHPNDRDSSYVPRSLTAHEMQYKSAMFEFSASAIYIFRCRWKDGCWWWTRAIYSHALYALCITHFIAGWWQQMNICLSSSMMIVEGKDVGDD